MREQTGSHTGAKSNLKQLLGGLAITILSLGTLVGAVVLSQVGAPEEAVPSTATSSGVAPTDTLAPSPAASATHAEGATATTAPLAALTTAAASATATVTPSPAQTEARAAQTATRAVQTATRAAQAATWTAQTATRAALVPTVTDSEVVPKSGTVTATPTAWRTPTRTPTRVPVETCERPWGWVVYVVQPGDSLSSLAQRTQTTVYRLMQVNCLSTQVLYVGQQLYLPSMPYVVPTAVPSPVPTAVPQCGPPAYWVVYIVRAGDTLYSLAVRTGTTVEAIRQANCLAGYTIYIGQRLYLPYQPVAPSPTPVPVYTSTPTRTPTAPVSPLATP